MDMNLLPESTPLVKFIQNCIRDPSCVFSIFTPTSADIDDVIFNFFTIFYAARLFIYIIERKLHGGFTFLANIVFDSKIKFAFSRRRVISFVSCDCDWITYLTLFPLFVVILAVLKCTESRDSRA